MGYTSTCHKHVLMINQIMTIPDDLIEFGDWDVTAVLVTEDDCMFDGV